MQRAYYTAQAVGWDNLPRRAWHVLKTRLGVNRRRLPGGELSEAELRCYFVSEYRPDDARRYWQARAARFFFAPGQRDRFRALTSEFVDPATWSRGVTRVVEGLRRGRMPMFSRFDADVGTPPRFNRDPVHSVDWPVGRHWSRYTQFDPALRDMKCVWEASRFSWAFYCAREYARTHDETIAALFWELFESWDQQNPYGLTPQWICGQEGTFRMFAWLFAALAMLDAAATTDQRLQRLTERVWYTGRHIQGNINYARSQKNNHAISEAAGLWTIGLCFAELARAPTWRAAGKRILENELRRQIYDDGSYVQHSLNYHRLMLDDVLWAGRLGELHDEPLSAEALERVERALRWLLEMIDPQSGRVPNYGNNDGALVLPLSTCDYLDFRPVAQAVHYLLHRKRCFAPGPWDEKLLWLFGPEALQAPMRGVTRRGVFRADAGGYYTLKGPRSWGLVRCYSYRDRPGQADMLHFDLWYDGQNVLRDGGSYHYYCDAPWQQYFPGTAAHNTLEVDDVDQMIRGPRFLWFRWTRARLNRFAIAADGRLAYFEGEHYGYTRLPGRVIHRRAICRIDDTYIVLDDVLGTGNHTLTLRWRLCDSRWELAGNACRGLIGGRALRLVLAMPPGMRVELVRGRAEPTPEGWESLYYAEKRPVPTIRLRAERAAPVRLVTLVSPGKRELAVSDPETLRPDAPLRLRGIEDIAVAPDLRALTAGRIGAAQSADGH
jgi:hypothetical protein